MIGALGHPAVHQGLRSNTRTWTVKGTLLPTPAFTGQNATPAPREIALVACTRRATEHAETGFAFFEV